MGRAQCLNVGLRGVVCAVPRQTVDIHEAGKHFTPEDREKASRVVGISAMHRSPQEQTAGDLCLAAAERLLKDLDWERESIDGLIFVTQTPDYVALATACVIQSRLGLSSGCIAFDVNLGCSGYVYGLWLASELVASGTCRRFLLLVGDTISHVASPQDQTVAMLFGDAGSATAVEFDPQAKPCSFVLSTDGNGYRSLIIPAGGFRHRPDLSSLTKAVCEDGNVRGPSDLHMNGLDVFGFMTQRVPESIRDAMSFHGWEASSVDAFLFHQANNFITKQIIRKLRLPPEKVPVNIERYGNTSGAAVPLLMADDLCDKLTGSLPVNLLIAGFGVGYSWGAGALTVSNLGTASVIEV